MVNALGQVLTQTDRNGNVHTLSYDVLGRITSDAVTTLGSGVNGSVRRIDTAYDEQGNPYLVTSYDAASGGNIVNQVQRAYNGLGQLITEWQSHSGAMNTSTTPKVQYAYTEMPSGANHSRLTSMTYPNGRTISYDYGTSSSLNDTISRLEAIKDGATTLESYSYLGVGIVVTRAHGQPGVDLTYVKRSGESNGDAGDQYIGLDRFGRIVDQRWVVASSGTARDRFQYTYDAMGNCLTRDNLVNSSFDEDYAYDNLNQLVDFTRGSHTIDWDYDALGNFDSVTTDGGSPVTRSANKQNEITSISGATTPVYDANGNMTGDETGNTFVYDAWNRLVAVKSGSTTLVSYKYDGHTRRIVRDDGTARNYYYSDQWQVLEERVGGNAVVQYVWSPVCVDAMILRDRDTDANGSLDERLYVLHDANFNVTAIIDTSGAVVERYAYDPYGARTIYDPSYAVRGSSSYDFHHGFQGMWYDTISRLWVSRGRPGLSPTLGVWPTTDPIRYKAGDIVLYRAMSNNLVNRVDPSGLADKPTWGSAGGQVTAGAVGTVGGSPQPKPQPQAYLATYTPNSGGSQLPADQLANPMNLNHLWAPGAGAAQPARRFVDNLTMLGYKSHLLEPVLLPYIDVHQWSDQWANSIISATRSSDAYQFQITCVSRFGVGFTIAPTVDRYGNIYLYTGVAVGKPGVGVSGNFIWYHTQKPLNEEELKDNVSGWCYDVGGIYPTTRYLGLGGMFGQSYSTGTTYNGILIGSPGRVATGGYTWNLPPFKSNEDVYLTE